MDQFIIRPAMRKDLNDLYHLASCCGIGMTNLPHDKDQLLSKIERSIQSFSFDQIAQEKSHYFFVLEDCANNQVVGCSAIISTDDQFSPFYNFKILTEIHSNPELNYFRRNKFIIITNDYQGSTEICGLFLLPNSRKNYNGFLLSKCRFLFMADFEVRFNDLIIAEMRGYVQNDQSPFWDKFMHKFIPCDLAEADILATKIGQKRFINDFIPRYPIYLNLLPNNVQNIIGKVHPDTLAALKILKREGFFYNKYIHLFDGGPVVECNLHSIKTIKNSRRAYVSMTKNSNENNNILCMISNAKLNFRACIASVALHNENLRSTISINERVMHNLEVEEGDYVRYIKLHKN